MKIINFGNKKKKLLTNEQQKSYENARFCFICKEKFQDKHAKNRIYGKVRDHCRDTGEYRSAAHSKCNLQQTVPREIAIAFYNGSNYDYHFIIKDFAEEFEEKFACLGENTEEYVTFSFPIDKEVTIVEYTKVTIDLIDYKCLCNKNFQKKFD